MDRVKHIVTGGWWKDRRTGKWVCASPKILKHIMSHPTHAALIGLPTRQAREPGALHFSTNKSTPLIKHQGTVIQGAKPLLASKAVNLTWADTLAARLVSVNTKPADHHKFIRPKGLVSCSGDVVHTGSFVIARREGVRLSWLSGIYFRN